MTKLKLYTDFVIMTNKQYEHCTLEEKLSVYVQHYPSVVVPLLLELVEETVKLKEELQFALDEANALTHEIIELRMTP